MRTLRTAFLFVVVFTVVAAIVTATWLQVAPWYTCWAILEARPEATSAVMSAQQGYVTTEMLEVLATKYASLAGSEPVLQTALASPEVRGTTWFQNSPDDALERLTNELNCSPLPGSALIVVSMTGEHKTELPDIVNAVANAARERSSEISNRGKQDQIHQLRQERTSLADTRDRIRADKAKLMRDAQVPDLTNSVYDSELRRMAEAVLSAELEFSEADQSVQLINQLLAKGDVSSLPQVMQFVERDPVVCGLLMRRAEMLAQDAHTRQDKGLPEVVTPQQVLPEEPAEVAPPGKAGTSPLDANAISADEASRALEELQNALRGLVPAATQPSRGDSKASDSKPRQEAESDRPGRAPTKGPSGIIGPTTSPASKGSGLSDIKYALDAIDSEIAGRKAHLVAVFRKSMLVDAENRKATILGRLTEMRQKYRMIDLCVRDLRATLSAYAQLEEQDKTLTDQINRIDSRLVDLRILLQGGAPVEVMQLAGTPLEPSFPKWSVMVPAGAGTGLVLGLLVSLIMPLVRRRRTTAEPPASN